VAIYVSGWSLLFSGRKAEAKACFEHALLIKPGNISGNYWLNQGAKSGLKGKLSIYLAIIYIIKNKKLIYRDLTLSLVQIKIQYNATRNSKIF